MHKPLLAASLLGVAAVVGCAPEGGPTAADSDPAPVTAPASAKQVTLNMPDLE